MEDKRLDMLAPKEEQLEVLVPYLERVAGGYEGPLPLTMRSKVLVSRILHNWRGFYNKEGIEPSGALFYYKKLKEEK